MMRLFGLKTCDTCRKALIYLKSAGYDPHVIDVRSEGIAPADRDRIVALFGDSAVNRASATWRSLSADERSLSVAALLEHYPTVMKRPVIEADGVWTIGWDRAVQARFGV
jgi:arsenate reductase-like glutaredoxin family protein